MNTSSDRMVVQIGANDGIRSDPVRPLICELGLPAVLVEPLPDFFEKLNKNYDGHAGVKCVQAAIMEKDGEETLYRVEAEADGFPEWVHGCASFSRDILEVHCRRLPGLDRHIKPVQVRAMQFSTLINEYKLDQVLILQVDTEGYDANVVRMALESGLRPRLIHYEYKHLSVPDQSICRRLLAKHNYQMLNHHGDTLAVLTDGE